MAYRNKTYICFDGDTDMRHYRLMTAWVENKNFSFDFHNAHDLNYARDSSQEESIKRQLRARLANSKLFVVLIGEKTKLLTKFVKWEMEAALKLDLPIVGVNLNGSRSIDDRCPPKIKSELAVYVPFGARIIEYAMTNWPANHLSCRQQNQTGAFHYSEAIYKRLGL
ncbi:TIR domain-containing protein [Nitratireductor aquibiodomus]|uniref:TIR domain-containing protein n=1 Tax=Nitratireductor aquibiodomus TaxID=204799 RepID=UPI0019D3C4A0|nr:TIR domain-containing protein [Nitratireductor aquibiodomus]MBN7760999.1 TIR domain-containing protein [Nitratireductor aquibiodomus]